MPFLAPADSLGRLRVVVEGSQASCEAASESLYCRLQEIRVSLDVRIFNNNGLFLDMFCLSLVTQKIHFQK